MQSAARRAEELPEVSSVTAELESGSNSRIENELRVSLNQKQSVQVRLRNPIYLIWKCLDPLCIPFEWHIRIVSSFYQNSVTHLRCLSFYSTANMTENILRESYLASLIFASYI